MSAPQTEILYHGETLRVVANKWRSPIRFVSFNHLLYREPPNRFWGDSFFDKYELGAIGFVSTKQDWFPEAEMRQALQAVAVAGALARAPGERLVSYGASMGGYAALKYASHLGVDAAVAFGAQVSIDPADVARFDTRFVRFHDPARHAGMRISGEDLAPENYILYDKFWTVDRKNADLIAALGPVERFALPCSGHACIRAVGEGHIAHPFLLRLVDPAPGKAAELRAMIRRSRRNTLVYWESRSTILAARRPAATRQILHAVDTTLILAPDQPIWRLARVVALLNCEERSEAEEELARVHLDGRSPGGLWVRYIDCHRRIHGDQATIEMMGRTSAEVQEHTAFRFEDAVIRFDMGDKGSAAAVLELIWPAEKEITRRVKLGLMLAAVGEKEKALAIFRAMAEEAPSAENLVQLAGVLAEDRANVASRAEALARLTEARAIIDPDPVLWRRLLLLYDRLDTPAEQIAGAREAAAALPGYPDLRMELAIALERGGEKAEALAIAARLVPEQARIRRLDWLILMLRQGGMQEEALALARTAARERPADQASRLQLAILLLAQEEEAEAFEQLLRVRANPPARLDLMEEATTALDAVGLHEDAAKAAARNAAAHIDQLAPQLLLAERLIRAGLLQETRLHLLRVRRSAGDDPARLIAIARLYRRAGEELRAEELLARALGERTEPAVAWMELIALRSKHGGWRARRTARRTASRLATSAAQDPAFWAGLAELFAALDRLPRALSAIGRASALDPDEPAYNLRAAELLLAAGKRSEAKTRLAALLEKSPSRDIFARALPLLEQAGDEQAACAAAERWLAAAPRDARASLALARALIRRGDIAAGRARLAELMKRRAGDATFWASLGELLLDLREWKEAKLAAERGIANDPGNAKRAREILGMADLVGSRPPASPGPRSAAHAMATRRPGILSRLSGALLRP
jgi:tetratricopeptide (TPR) repeat protein